MGSLTSMTLAMISSDVTAARLPRGSNRTLRAGSEKRVKKPSSSVWPALCRTTSPVSHVDARYSFCDSRGVSARLAIGVGTQS